ncbi:Gfo/Idh/MocA family oxidoreductase [Bifidobacterium sp. 82T10]|uniref:Gfo/Idh/MocA family oxidoreductase n=1 Tax=Bifidobacterium miconis TaxID=2834435 RepID=A0ABS6WEW7_9BIFI|nr:Gfo/Idh/MocA family oxidoreductase [Bifidobacterium miconis]MBW3092593.1 Gfo/Idh/MocA family oxidoreductase [Bifidobacterium miconis]
MSKITPVHAGIIGCGAISDAYLNNLTGRFASVRAVACADRHGERARDKAERYGLRAMAYQSMLDDPDIAMIVNLTPPAAHYDVTRAALEHGKHVFSEKMIAVDLEQGRELMRLADAHGVRLGVAPDTFLCGGIQTSRYIVDHGLIGDVTSANVAVNRNLAIYGDIMPFLEQPGGGMPFDYGCYHMTALAYLLGPAVRVSAFSRVHAPSRMRMRTDRNTFGETVTLTESDIVTATVEYASGTLATIQFNGASNVDEHPIMDVYGTHGILRMGDPNAAGAPVRLRKPLQEEIAFPFTHGFLNESRGVGAAEMAWAIARHRPHRAGKEMAFHVFELIHGMIISARTEEPYRLSSTFVRPTALPEGYLPNGAWGPTEESALAAE